MSDTGEGRPKRPAAGTQFKKGQSGNPAGRPKKTKAAPQASAFDVVIDRTLKITQGGRLRDVTVDEALQHKTYQDAIAGNRAARREVLRMIAIREKALAALAARTRPAKAIKQEIEQDPTNMEEALLILGIARHDPLWTQTKAEDRRLLLERWAVQAALSRPGRKPLSEHEVAEVERCTDEANKLAWPGGKKR